MKQDINDIKPFIPPAILPALAFIITYILYRPPFLDWEIGLVSLVGLITAFSVALVFPLGNSFARSLRISLPTFIAFLIIYVFLPIVQTKIYEPEDYVVYYFFCGLFPIIGLVFWFIFACFIWAGSRLSILARERNLFSAFRTGIIFWISTVVLAGISCGLFLIQRNTERIKAELLFSYGLEVFEFPKQSLLSFSENKVHTIRLDQQGMLWVATRSGIFHRVGANKWDRFLSPSFATTNGMELDQTDRVWVSANSGIYTIVPGEDEIKIADFQYSPIILDTNGSLWYRCERDQYCNGTTHEKINLGAKTLLAFDSLGQIWAYESHSTTIEVFNGEEWKATSLDGHTLPYGRFPSAFDNRGNLWVSVDNEDKSNGVCCTLAHYDDAQWHIEDAPFEVKYETKWYAKISDIAFDSHDRLWVSAGIAETGLAMKDGDTWKFFDLSSLINDADNVHTVFIDRQNQLWVGAGSFLIHFNLEKGDPVTKIPTATDLSQTIELLWASILLFALLACICFVIGFYKSLSITND